MFLGRDIVKGVKISPGAEKIIIKRMPPPEKLFSNIIKRARKKFEISNE